MSQNLDIVECVFVDVAVTEKKNTVACRYKPLYIYDSSCFINSLSQILHGVSGGHQDCFFCEEFNLDYLQ